jgi:hypothetical protein
VDAPSRLIERVWLPDPCNNFAGSGNSLPRLKYSLTPFALARIAKESYRPVPPLRPCYNENQLQSRGCWCLDARSHPTPERH